MKRRCNLEKKWRWTMQVEVDADDEVEASARIEEQLDMARYDPEGLISYGELKQLWPVPQEGED